jgi:hypothetical protein
MKIGKKIYHGVRVKNAFEFFLIVGDNKIPDKKLKDMSLLDKQMSN